MNLEKKENISRSRNSISKNNFFYLQNHNSIIYYNKKYKHPSIVIEFYHQRPKNSGIRRVLIGDPFQQDKRIPEKYQYTIADYIHYCQNGGSYGHNAPAFLHKSSEREYRDTYLFSNITPQEVVFNSGLWLLFEGVTDRILKKYNNAIVINGSLESKKKVFDDDYTLYIPQKMYKIIIYYHNNTYYYVAFIGENRPYYLLQTAIEHRSKDLHLKPYSMDISDLFHQIEKETKIKFKSSILNNIQRGNEDFIYIDKSRIQQMKSSELYGNIIYSKNKNELNQIVPNIKKLNPFHTIYYNYAIKKLGL